MIEIIETMKHLAQISYKLLYVLRVIAPWRKFVNGEWLQLPDRNPSK